MWFNIFLMTYVTYRVYANFTSGLYASALISLCIALGFCCASFSSSAKWRYQGQCLMIATLLVSLLRLAIY